jgi:hypothetical protein
MPRIYTLSDISEGSKLGSIPSNRYPPNRIELENQLACANRDREIALECGSRLANKCSALDKDNKRIQRDLKQSNKEKEKLSKHAYRLIEEVKRLSSELDSLISQITCKDISLNESKIKIKDLQSKIKILETKLSSTQNESKEITALRSMKKILEGKLKSAQKDAFSTQEEIVKKESEIISLKSELTNIKNELASKINEIECLGTLRPALQKTKNILDPVVMGGEEGQSLSHVSKRRPYGPVPTIKNMQSEEQSFISNSGDTSESRPEGSLLCNKSLAKYFKSKTLPIITNNQNPESLIQDTTNKQNSESLIQDITIKRAVCAGEALVNDKYQIPHIISVSKPLAKIVIIAIIVILIIWYIYRNIFHPLPPSRSLNSKPDYSHRMTASDNLFSGIYSGASVETLKPTMNEQSEVNYRGEEIFYPVYRNYSYEFPI